MFKIKFKTIFQKKKNSKKTNTYTIATPEEIRSQVSNMSRCDKCHFLIFNNYWSAIQIDNEKLCPTCGTTVLNNKEKEVVTL